MPLILGYDPETLREQVDLLEVGRRIDALGQLRSRDAICERAWLFKVSGQLDEALDQANQALRLARFTGERRDIQRPRLLRATILQAHGRYDEALSEFTACIADARTHEWRVHEAIGLQHRGKTRFEIGELDAALADFRAALALREAAGAPEDQLESTRFAIRAVEAARQRA
ncbi:hypothetical protein [Agromyces archimandritae]|uniref:Tetratricopeptide repeat protein n=1 Tax=Agromyces archimandritae TaxID=2781962 RepID=A0A975FQ86_9MICO|nr:hypothetical protein [Agromyces archimandritae]QTX05822.1 hypothetical protein G127AT_06365 [Agromyces archimandritae]